MLPSFIGTQTLSLNVSQEKGVYSLRHFKATMRSVATSIHAGPALPYDDTPISDSIIDNFTWDNSWDILGPESNLTLIPGATLRQISPLGIGGLESFVETGAHDSTQFEQFRPAINEDFRPRSTSILDQYRPAVSSRHVTTTLDNFRQFLSRPTDIQWTFCASIMVSYIGTFAKTASTDFIAPYKLQSPLAAALGVCAAHETLTGPGRLVLSKLIEAGIDNLICYVPRETALSATNVPTLCDLDNCLTLEDDLRFFRRELARVQAMTLYHIIACFGGDAKQKSQAAQHEPLLAAWKISLQEQMHKLYHLRSALGNARTGKRASLGIAALIPRQSETMSLKARIVLF
ncbi:hypothetical protein TrVGV298_010972 [Trichoderma virens]|nr:hypothetical protein TrVGV298_010972 [Trichoderma virens]